LISSLSRVSTGNVMGRGPVSSAQSLNEGIGAVFSWVCGGKAALPVWSGRVALSGKRVPDGL